MAEANLSLMEPSPCLSMARLPPLPPQLSSRSDSVLELGRRGSLHLETPLQQRDQGLQAHLALTLVQMHLALVGQPAPWTVRASLERRTCCFRSARLQSASELESRSAEHHYAPGSQADAPLQPSAESVHQV